MMEKVKVSVAGKNPAPIEANVVIKSDEVLVVYFTAADIKVTMTWRRDQYFGTMAGMELASDGKVIR